jgi:hypothetical protein
VISRRTVLGAGAVIAAGGVGALVAAVQPRHQGDAPRVEPPPVLTGALAREDALVAGLEAALHGDSALGARLHPLRDDHSAHAAALRSALAAYPTSTASPSSSTTPTAPTLAALRAAEVAAARSAADDSLALQGADAALLASIAACEATHAEVLA